MPNKDGTGPVNKGQRCRAQGLRKGQSGGRGRAQNSSGGRQSGAGTGSGRRQAQGKKWQRNKNQ